jgi:hypothetical protein
MVSGMVRAMVFRLVWRFVFRRVKSLVRRGVVMAMMRRGRSGVGKVAFS